MESKFVPWYETEISNKILNGEFLVHCASANQRRQFGNELLNLEVRVDPDFLTDDCFDHYYFQVQDMSLFCVSIANHNVLAPNVSLITYEHLTHAYKSFRRTTPEGLPFPNDVLQSFCTNMEGEI